jgi:hypothetical protein
MEKRELLKGDILQINPTHERWPGFFMVVTETKEWGAQGYLLWHCDFEAVRFGEKAYVRMKFEEVEYCGREVWIKVYDKEEE